MAFKKGSKEAKDYMSKVRASKVSGVKKKKAVLKKKAIAKKKIAPKKAILNKKAVAKKKIAPKKVVKRNIKLDSIRPALLPGKRISNKGKIYYEYRENHSDNKLTTTKGKMLGVSNSDLKKYAFKQYNNSLDNIKGFEILISKIENIIANNRITKTYNSSTILELKKELKKSKELLKEHKLHSKELKKFL
jgi:hypothetical protein